MDLIVFFTAHRQLEELDLQPRFFERSEFLKKNAFIVYHSNNPDISADTLHEKLGKIPCRGYKLIQQTQNPGYSYGNFAAIYDAYEALLSYNPDWVIKLHPDIFIVDDAKIQSVLSEASEQNKSLVVGRIFGNDRPAYGADFFAFRPQEVPASLFAVYEPFLRQSVFCGEEHLLHFEAVRREIPLLEVPRFTGGRYYRDLDNIGLWHDHNLDRVKAFLDAPGKRWKVTARRCLTQPQKFVFLFLKWSARRFVSGTTETLKERLAEV